MATSIDLKGLKKKIRLAIHEKGDLRKITTRSMKQMAEVVIAEILQRVSSGISPITGKRFPAYKNPKKYPAKQKGARPVNLYLTGQFLKSLVYRIKTGINPVITVTFSNNEAFEKELGHREGANGQRKRPIIPQGQESFAKGILTSVRQVFRKVVDRDLK